MSTDKPPTTETTAQALSRVAAAERDACASAVAALIPHGPNERRMRDRAVAVIKARGVRVVTPTSEGTA